MGNYGISRWDDPVEINAKLKALTSQPIWEVDDDYYNNVVMKYFNEKCKASKAVFEEAKAYIPGAFSTTWHLISRFQCVWLKQRAHTCMTRTVTNI